MRHAARSLAPLVVLATGLAACTDVERGTTPHNGRDTMPGPGLFSGPPGEWVILQRRLSATAHERGPRAGVATP
jgi:hypothetical protein